MKILKLIPFLILLVLTSCSKDPIPTTSLEPELESIESRTRGYKECDNSDIHILSSQYNSLNNVICCNYSGEGDFLDVLATGAVEHNDIEWNIQGVGIKHEIGGTVITDLGCPAVGTCKNVTFQFIDHTLKCKTTLNTRVCNNSGPCFISTIENCKPGETYQECLCRQHPNHPSCSSGGMF